MLSSLKNLTNSSAIKSAYTINEEGGFRAGAWLVQDAVRKSTKQEVSVLTFSKKSLEQPLQRTSSALRQSFDAIYTQLKGEAATLARLRHPAMLEVVESIEESRNSIMFVTERVTGCLSSMVSDEESDSFSHRSSRGESTRLDEIEIQKGLLQVTIGLEFLQSVAQIVHGNLVPSSIFINQKGDWKLGGFAFSLAIKESPRYIPPDYDNRLPQSVQRNLDYAAPEFVIDETIDPLNDMFSLGCLICALVSPKHRSIINCNQNIHLYRKAVESINVHTLTGIPPYLRDVLPQLLTRRPANRLSAHAFQSSPFFDNILMNSIRFLDAFPEKTTSERQSFMKGLCSVIPQFPPRVLLKKILPGLLDQFQDHSLLPLILPNIFLIAEGMTQKGFSQSVLPKLKSIFKLEDSPGATMFLLEKMPMMKTKMTALELKEDGMTLVYTALSGDVQYLQEKALLVSADLVKDLDLVTIKTALFPKIAEVFTHTTMLGTKVTALQTFNELVVHSLDKYTITEKLIPLLKGIKTKEPAVGMAALTLSKSCGAKIDHENIAFDLLPQLWSMALGPLLSQSQFKQFMSTIKELSAKVESEQTKKLSDSGAPAGETGQTHVTSGDLMGDGPSEEISFEHLVLGNKSNVSSTNTVAPSAPNGRIGAVGSRTLTPMPMTLSSTNTAPPVFSWSTPAPSPVPATTAQFQPPSQAVNAQFQAKPAIPGLSTYPALSPAPTGSFMAPAPPMSKPTTPFSTTTPNYNIQNTSIDWSAANSRPAFSGTLSSPYPGIQGPAAPSNPFPRPPLSSPNPVDTIGNGTPSSTKATTTMAKRALDSYQSLL